MLTRVLIVSCLTLLTPVFAQEKRDVDVDETVAALKEQLELSDEQAGKVKGAIGKFALSLKATTDKKEEAEPDTQAMLSEVKAARDTYQKEMLGILSKDQWKGYQALVNKVLDEMATDIAEMKLMDLQEPLKIKDDQMEKLTSVMGSSLRSTMSLLFENAGKKLRMPKKIKLAKSLKKIQSDQQKACSQILSPEQMKAWEQLKEAQKKKKS